MDDQAFLDDNGWTAPPAPYQRSGQNIVQLLFRVSEDATRRNAYVHRGCACNSCNMVPIRGIRYRCANCADYDLCEGCESQGFHNKTHIFYKIKVPAPSFGPRNIQPVWYTGDPDATGNRALPKALMNKLSRETGFERPELDAYWEQWTYMANTDWRDDPDDINLAMDRKTFERCLVPSGGYKHAAPSLIFERMFSFYDTNKDDLISFPEFLHGLAYRKKKDKWAKIFEGYDVDKDGYVDRKDFLRMFRSYYALYRQMHRDMLEGMDEQQMISIDAHRLVTSRQPLSSAFGQDGRYPSAPDPRTGQGKVARGTGDLEIVDGKGVISESSDDTGNREDLFRSRGPMPTRPRSRGYWNALLNPPMSIEQLPDVIRGLALHTPAPREAPGLDALAQAAQIAENPNAHPVIRMARNFDDDNDGFEDSDKSSNESDSGLENDENWPPTYVTITDEDAEAVAGPGTRVSDLQGENREAAIREAMQRERAQRDISERWKRRQFYTDEEEGATPPSNWTEADDTLAQVSMNGESSKSQARPSIHSRSSSKVRFAEELDDFDTRSNPSTSSRSVPERWGGMDIPDAEKDAGKEILYQTTQQAFNELLDPLFEAKENLAFDAAETKADRDRYRYIFGTPWFETWASTKEHKEEKTETRQSKVVGVVVSNNPPWPEFPEVEVEQVSITSPRLTNTVLMFDIDEVIAQVRQRSLSELLDATGYTLDVDALAPAERQSFDAETAPLNSIGDIVPPFTTIPRARVSVEVVSQHLQPSTEVPPGDEHHDIDAESTSTISMAAATLDSLEESPDDDSSYRRDPTLPQFRPNVSPPLAGANSSNPVPGLVTLPETTISSPPASPRPVGPMSIRELAKDPSSLDDLPGVLDAETSQIVTKEFLLKLRDAEKTEKEKEERGGWGRLNFEEWEGMVKTFVREGKGNQMDYLGAWIEFCIP